MLLLATTTDKVQVITSSANALDATASFVDLASGTATPQAPQGTNIASAATTTIVSSPGSGVVRNVKQMILVAKGGANTVTIQVVIGAGPTTANILGPITLAANYTLVWTDGYGWELYTDSGQLVTTGSPGAAAPTVSYAAAGAIGSSGNFIRADATLPLSRSIVPADVRGWTFLGNATASAAVRTGTITWTGTFQELAFEYFIAGYSGSAIARLVVGPTAGLSETGTTFCTELTEGGTRNTTSVSVPGWPTAVTAGAVQRYGWMYVKNIAAAIKRMTGTGNHSGTAPTTVPTSMLMNGLFNDTTNLIQKAELCVYDTITATTVSATTMNAGTYLNVWGRNAD